ncbi:DUF2948 family protein [Jiella sp. MQZ9-1]|uniref:DUF2948 family protein n=1 Tax=Jiella flava TaxID=2816857 RepID=A0A939JVU9_9HYPH|nr:DUF2948 family protein [Jiella flava]MBO0661641.1 DUF2948 family protein [Jiella flava]MCD2470283.1 DUF2948 family protein [Jiella flava]
MDRMRLLAVDAEDLEIVSAHCQDAVLRVDDLRYVPKDRRFVMEMNRFVWEKLAPPKRFSMFRRADYERRRAILHFDRVTAARRLGFERLPADEVLVLLAIRFAEEDEPSGVIELVFAGGSAIRLEVEVIEAQLADVGGAWGTLTRPNHGR